MRLSISVLASLVALGSGCGLFIGRDEQSFRVAAHATSVETWYADPCFRSGPDCADEIIEITRAKSDDPDVVEATFDGNVVTLVTHGPGDATIDLVGKDSYYGTWTIEVVEPGGVEFLDDRVVEQHVLFLAGAEATYGFDVLDVNGDYLYGVPSLALSGTNGARAEVVDGARGMRVTAPSELGEFEIELEGVGMVLTGEVISPGDIDRVWHWLSMVTPAIDRHLLSAGVLEIRVSNLDTGCIVDTEGWGIAPPPPSVYPHYFEGDADGTWSLSALGSTVEHLCGGKVTLPQANGGAGVETYISL